jgi:hypothetical protein
MRWFALVATLALAGCSMTVNALHPRPSVSVSGDLGKFALDASAIPDDYEPGRLVHIHQFRQTLANALHAAVGERFSATADPAAVRLVFTDMSMEFSNISDIGVFLLIRFHAKWLAADGHLIAEVGGTAKPVNVTETGERHVEDAVEVMFGQLVDGLDKALHPGAAR